MDAVAGADGVAALAFLAFWVVIAILSVPFGKETRRMDTRVPPEPWLTDPRARSGGTRD